MRDLATTLVTGALLAGFLWLMTAALRNAWGSEQEHKAREAAWRAAHPVDAPTPGSRRMATTASLAYLAIGLLTAAYLRLNLVQSAIVLSLPVLAIRRWHQYQREHDAANRERFGPYEPTFRERR